MINFFSGEKLFSLKKAISIVAVVAVVLNILGPIPFALKIVQAVQPAPADGSINNPYTLKDHVTFCHESSQGKYNSIAPAIKSIFLNDQGGHAQDVNDIIPSFYYINDDDQTVFFVGINLSTVISSQYTGQDILNNNCVVPGDVVVEDVTFDLSFYKYLDGALATSASANNSIFLLNALTSSFNGTLALGPSDPYSTSIQDVTKGDNLSVSEDTTGSVLPYGAECEYGKFIQDGYSYGETQNSAVSAQKTTSSLSLPINFDTSFIVWNKTCPPPSITLAKTATYNATKQRVTYTINWQVNGGTVNNLQITDMVPDWADLLKTSVTPVPTSYPIKGNYNKNTPPLPSERMIVWDLGTKNKGDSGSASFLVELWETNCEVNNTVNATATYGNNLPLSASASAATTYVVSPHCEEIPPPPADACPNIEGNQTQVPEGMIKNEAGNCVQPEIPPTDICENVDGLQITMPDGYKVVETGFCVIVVDPAIVKTVDNGNPAPGATIVFTIVVSNTSSTTATNITVTDPMPSGVTYQSDDAVVDAHTTYDSNTKTLVWTIPSIAANSSVTLNITAVVDGDASGDISNTASITSGATEGNDNTNNDSSTASVVVDDDSITINPSCTSNCGGGSGGGNGGSGGNGGGGSGGSGGSSSGSSSGRGPIVLSSSSNGGSGGASPIQGEVLGEFTGLPETGLGPMFSENTAVNTYLVALLVLASVFSFNLFSIKVLRLHKID